MEIVQIIGACVFIAIAIVGVVGALLFILDDED